jgi:hypothetical protein
MYDLVEHLGRILLVAAHSNQIRDGKGTGIKANSDAIECSSL